MGDEKLASLLPSESSSSSSGSYSSQMEHNSFPKKSMARKSSDSGLQVSYFKSIKKPLTALAGQDSKSRHEITKKRPSAESKKSSVSSNKNISLSEVWSVLKHNSYYYEVRRLPAFPQVSLPSLPDIVLSHCYFLLLYQC